MRTEPGVKRFIQWAALLYPAGWRARYGLEFAALLDDIDLRWADIGDILTGALKMRMRTWTFWKAALGFGILGLAVATVLALRTPNRYVSTAVLRLDTSQPAELAARQLNQAEQTVLSRSSLSQLIVSDDLYKTDRASRPIEDIVEDMRNKYIQIRVLDSPGHPTQQSNAFSVAFQYSDAAKAQAATQALVGRFMDETLRAPIQGAKLEVLDPANLPARPFEPNRPAWIAMGLVLGLLLGVVVFGAGKWPRVALAAFGVAFLALIGASFIPDRYKSIAVMRGADDNALQRIVQADANPAFLQAVIQGPLHLYPNQPIVEAVSEMRDRNMRIRRLAIPGREHSSAVTIEFQYADESHAFRFLRKSDRYKAQAVVRELVNHAFQVAQADPSHPQIELLDPASLPEQSVYPNRLAFVLTGLLAGLVLGVVWQLRSARPSSATAVAPAR